MMHKKSKINKKQSKGITLIALVITIIVLLILAGVTINTLFDNGNAIDKAAEARDETNKGNIKEQLDLAVITSRINDNNANIDIDKLESELEKLKNTGIIDSYKPSESDFQLPSTVKKDDYEFTIDEDGNVTAKDGQTLTNAQKKEKVNDVIGQTVEYGVPYSGLNHEYTKENGWRVFYASEDEMFLITADTIANQTLSITGYTNSNDVFTPKTAETESNYTYKNVTYGEKYNSKWKAILGTTTNTNDNSKATAYLCDPKNWTKYISPTAPNGTYAVGGPTKELLALSWEAAGYNAQWSNDINDDVIEKGYLYNKPAGLRDNNPLQMTILNSLYSTGDHYWLASPGSDDTDYVCSVNGDGYVSLNHYYSGGHAIRPIVSIPISNVQIGEDGKVTIE